MQQYLCRACGHQWAESKDPLVASLRELGIDARRHGIFEAVVLFVRGKSMSSIEKKTGIKSETLRKYLEILRKPEYGWILDPLLKAEAGLSWSDLAEFHGFLVECDMEGIAYSSRGKWLKRAKEEDKRKRKQKGAGTAAKRHRQHCGPSSGRTR